MTDPSTPSNQQPASTPPAYSPSTPSTPSYSAAAPAKYNTLAIVGFILAFFVSIGGLIVSIIARNQIKQTGEQGAGLALAGIIISAVSIVLTILWIIIAIAIAAAGAASYSSY